MIRITANQWGRDGARACGCIGALAGAIWVAGGPLWVLLFALALLRLAGELLIPLPEETPHG